jgi:Protein of unknown function (DUF3592)
MQLDVNGTITANPTADDIARALDAKGFAEGWYIALDDGAGNALGARAQADGAFTLSYRAGKRGGRDTADAAAVKSAFLDFLAGQSGARSAARPKFVADTRPLYGRGSQTPAWAKVVMVAVVLLVSLIFGIEHLSPGTIRDNVPYGDSDLFWIGLIFLPMLVLVIVAIASKTTELRRAKSWAQISGRIVRSQMEVQRHQFSGEQETVKNVPAVEYEFTVGARKVIGRRIGIGDDALAQPEATLKRYPVGASVTVYYDAKDPTRCVLERGGPDISKREAATGCVFGLVLLAVAGGAIYGLFTQGPDFILAHFPHLKSDPRFSIFAICFGLVTLLFYVAALRYSEKAAKWPSVRGKIESSRVERYEEMLNDNTVTRYRPVVEFSYAVDGQPYRGNQIKLMLQLGGSEASAAKVVAKYPPGGEVAVHYEPGNPANAALEIPVRGPWILLLLALACFLLAVWQLGVLG